MLLGLPPAGVLLRGGSLGPYLEFPPQTRFIDHAPFSWIAFGMIGSLVAVSAAPLVRGLLRPAPRRPISARSFPWWGWGGLTLGIAAWALAWTRFPWFTALQPHTFPLLWGAFILVANALTWRRSGATCVSSTGVARRDD